MRGFIETMLEAELSAALSRPRHGRFRPEEDEATPSVVVGCNPEDPSSKSDGRVFFRLYRPRDARHYA